VPGFLLRGRLSGDELKVVAELVLQTAEMGDGRATSQTRAGADFYLLPSLEIYETVAILTAKREPIHPNCSHPGVPDRSADYLYRTVDRDA